MLQITKKFLAAGLLSTGMTLLLDLAAATVGLSLTITRLGLLWAACVAAITSVSIFGKISSKCILKVLAIAAGITALAAVMAYGTWRTFVKTEVYRDVDAGKERLYGNRNMMVIVPHQDDEINILGGTIEEFVRYGSTVRIVFVTNGDLLGIGPTRLQEALDYGAYVGVPEENIIFLGYGDQWDAEGGVHIYNAEPGTAIKSGVGAEKTYGLPGHPAYREGTVYTVENYLSDIESVILEYQPDMIFCSDYDNHIDHKALTLAFDKVMGKILQEQTEYRPLVFKGYAYSSAWYAVPDYYHTNILSTENVFEEPYRNRPAVYHWEQRLRFPVDAGTLSRSLVNSKAYGALAVHDSQNARHFAESVVNGDRVFWHRRTDSECASAQITVSSGCGTYLNNFMLIDNWDLWNKADACDSVWIPDREDADRTVQVTLQEKRDLCSIVLYDHPSEEHNVLNARIEFDDGTQLQTGALHELGAATEIPVNKSGVKSFSVTLLETEGEDAGMTEVEAYGSPVQGDIAFGKLMDAAGNFVYDYWMESGDSCAFSVYTVGTVGEEFRAECDNERMQVKLSGKDLQVSCPEGEGGTVSVYDGEGALLDSIYVSNPGFLRTLHMRLAQTAEKIAGFRCRQTGVYRLGKLCREFLEQR